jgi:GR25 family glycosyltransferase involved in LPS biosynthesis
MPCILPTYILYSKHEAARANQVTAIQQYFTNAIVVESIFPKYEKVPFLDKLIKKSKERTGAALLTNEIGVLLSHRSIWQTIIKKARVENTHPNTHYLILESDSKINNFELIQTKTAMVEKNYDLFFWGAWNNHVSIKRSSILSYEGKYRIGSPLIRSVYGAYGYSLNAKAAQKMLASTKKIKYPVDLYKQYDSIGGLSIGAIQPELISTWLTTESSIRPESNFDKFKRILRIKIFSCRNQIQAYFC